MTRPLILALLALLTLSAGCYTWKELPRPDIMEGSRVRVTLRVGTAESLGERAELPGLRRRIEAEVQQANAPGTLGLLVPRAGATPADRTGLSAFLSVPWDAIETVERKTFSPRRTAAFAGVAAITTAALLSLQGGGTKEGQNPPPVNERVRVPLFRLIVR